MLVRCGRGFYRNMQPLFNICPHKLNQISGPPLEIHLEDNVKPRVLQNPAHVLIY